jgi:hypothetical protein
MSDCRISLADNSRLCEYLPKRLELIVLQSVDALEFLEKKVILLLQRLRLRETLANVKYT